MIQIRLAHSHDTAALEELFLVTRQQTFSSRDPNAFKLEDYLNSTAEEEVWVAADITTILGFVSIFHPANFIHNLFVHPKYQGLGLGIQLLQTAENHLNKPMALKVALDNAKVFGFYEKHGWVKVSTHTDNTEPYVLYQKS